MGENHTSRPQANNLTSQFHFSPAFNECNHYNLWENRGKNETE